MHGVFGMLVLMKRGRRVSLILVQERILRLLVHEGSKDRTATIRAKAVSGLLVSQD